MYKCFLTDWFSLRNMQRNYRKIQTTHGVQRNVRTTNKLTVADNRELSLPTYCCLSRCSAGSTYRPAIHRDKLIISYSC